MRLLITGGLGFIGSNFIRYILNKYQDYKIINLDIASYCGNFDNLRDVETSPRYGFVRGDIADPSVVDFLVKRRPEAVINFAAQSHVDRSISNARAFLDTEVIGTFTLLEAVKKYNISLFCQVSTDETYGTKPQGQFSETDPLNPNNPYSAAKASGDLLVRAYNKTFNIPTLITRTCNNFGPYQYPEKLIPLFVTNLLDDLKVPIYGDGLQVREWIYVLDNCSAIDHILHHGKIGEIYNIGTGIEKTNIEITKTILRELEKDEGYIEYVADRPGHDRRYCVDWSKISTLGWRPQHDFKEALTSTVNWYKENRWWWEKIKYGADFKKYYKNQYKIKV